MSDSHGAAVPRSPSQPPPSTRGRYFGLILALLAGVAVAVVARIIKASWEGSVALGLVVFVASQLVDLAFRLDSSLNALASGSSTTNDRLRDTDDLLESLSAAYTLHGHSVKAVQQLRSTRETAGRDLAETLERVLRELPDVPPPLLNVVRLELEKTAEPLVKKEFVVPGDPLPYIGTHLARNFRTHVSATSLYPLKFWLTGWGSSYQEAMCARAKELKGSDGVTLKRVFIVQEGKAEPFVAEYSDLIREQMCAGIKVQVCYESELSPEECQDFGIWDRQLVVRVQVSANDDRTRRVISSAYRYDSGAIARAEALFGKIWDNSRPFDMWVRSNLRVVGGADEAPPPSREPS
jgi:hypothetical protein